MIFEPLALAGAFLVRPEPVPDRRGFFARTWCELEFEQHNIHFRPVQSALSFNPVAGTLRGLHYQAPPHEEDKLVSCIRGSIFDVLVDLRHRSPTLRQWVSVELSEHALAQVFIPRGIAHGYLTSTSNSLVHYHLSSRYHEEAARGLRFDDPTLGIVWPRVPAVISERDRSFPLLA